MVSLIGIYIGYNIRIAWILLFGHTTFICDEETIDSTFFCPLCFSLPEILLIKINFEKSNGQKEFM